MSLSFRFGTVGSPAATPPRPGGSVGGIKCIADLGMDTLELAWVSGVRVSEATCAAIKETALAHGVVLSIHAPYYINLNAEDEKWPRLRKYLMDAAYFGNLAGATDVVFHPGTYFNRPVDEVMGVVIPRLSACAEELHAVGNPITLRPETMGKSAVIGSLQDILGMAKAIPGILPCMDFAHLHARHGDGSMNSYEEWIQALEACKNSLGEAAMQRLHVHLSGIEYGPKGERNHLVMEEADLDFKSIFRALKDSGCKGRILCESPVLEEDALKMKTLWQKISGEAA